MLSKFGLQVNILHVFIILFLCSCNLSTGISNSKILIYKKDRFLIKDTYSNMGELRQRQYFNNDTLPDGPAIDYFPDGKIGIWRWYKYKEAKPHCIVFYNKNGIFDSLKGNPFLRAKYVSDTIFYLQCVKPPQLTYIIKINDTYKGELLNSKAFEPFETDTINWVAISHNLFEKYHAYNIDFCIIDTITSKILYEYHEKLNLSKNDIVK